MRAGTVSRSDFTFGETQNLSIMADTWLSSLITKTPQEGYELAIKMSRMGVKYTQPSAEVRDRLRSEYAENADSLTAAAHVIAVNFQTVAAANGYWKNA